MFKLQGGWGIKSLFQFVHAYWYLTKTDQYVKILADGVSFSIKYLPHWFGRWAMGLVVPYYHGKVMRREDVKKVLTLNVDLRVTDDIAERVVPFEAARSIIVEHPDHIVVGDCPCRAYRGEAACSSEKYGIQYCMFIGEPFVSFILDHAQINPLRITVEEALERLEDVHKRGWVSSMFFKDICGQRSYAICNLLPMLLRWVAD